MASQLEGVAELTGKLFALGAQFVPRELRGSVKDALEPAKARAEVLIPVGVDAHQTYRGRLVPPGYARSTIHIEVKLDKKTGSAIASLGVAREAFYAVQFVELGTAFMPAQPWLRPAFTETQDQQLTTLRVSLAERVEKVAKSKARAAQRARLAGR